MTTMDPKSELTLTALTYVVKQAAMGNIKIPLGFNLTERQINELLTLNTQELSNMANISHINLMDITFDAEAVAIAIEINNAKSKRRNEVFELLKAGASYPVMAHLYGLTAENIGHYKKMIGMPSDPGGRPCAATDDEKVKLWELLGKEGSFNDEDLAEKLMDAHKETKLKICTIWTVLKEYWIEEKEQK